MSNTRVAWLTSSYSAGGGNCVEVAEGKETLVRDTQNRDLGHLVVPATEWTALLRVAATE